MDDKSYEELLERAYKSIPEKAVSGERFEIPKFDMFVEGNKTIIRNYQAVVEKLRRSSDLLTKFFSKELAVPISTDGGRMILHGKLMTDNVNRKLEEFTLKYVLCRECKKPDTNITEIGHGFKQITCEVCGAKNTVK
jgi:translation initiation factor 2 subunit 2